MITTLVTWWLTSERQRLKKILVGVEGEVGRWLFGCICFFFLIRERGVISSFQIREKERDLSLRRDNGLWWLVVGFLVCCGGSFFDDVVVATVVSSPRWLLVLKTYGGLNSEAAMQRSDDFDSGADDWRRVVEEKVVVMVMLLTGVWCFFFVCWNLTAIVECFRRFVISKWERRG